DVCVVDGCCVVDGVVDGCCIVEGCCCWVVVSGFVEPGVVWSCATAIPAANRNAVVTARILLIAVLPLRIRDIWRRARVAGRCVFREELLCRVCSHSVLNPKES